MNMEKKDHKKIILAITGASGSIYGIRLLEILKKLKVETHLIISQAAHITLTQETDLTLEHVKSISNYNYNPKDISSRISSGSFKTTGMIIAPCSMNSLAKIACGIESNLVSRAAGVVLKERRRFVLMCRDTPLNSGHLENMLKVSNHGAIIAPPVPAFYNLPKNIDDTVNHSVARVLDLFDIEADLINRWEGVV